VLPILWTEAILYYKETAASVSQLRRYIIYVADSI